MRIKSNKKDTRILRPPPAVLFYSYRTLVDLEEKKKKKIIRSRV